MRIYHVCVGLYFNDQFRGTVYCLAVNYYWAM